MPLNWSYLAIAVLSLIGIVLLFRAFRTRRPVRASYHKQDFLFTPEERQVYLALREAVGAEYAILGQVRVEDVIEPRSFAHPDPDWEQLVAAGEDTFPFLLCKLPDLSIACAVQLIEHRPARPSRQGSRNEHPLKAVCAAVALPLLRIEAGPFYDRNDLRQAVADAVRKEPLFITEGDGRKEPTLATLEKLKF
jgi:hypothetical protein